MARVWYPEKLQSQLAQIQIGNHRQRLNENFVEENKRSI